MIDSGTGIRSRLGRLRRALILNRLAAGLGAIVACLAFVFCAVWLLESRGLPNLFIRRVLQVGTLAFCVSGGLLLVLRLRRGCSDRALALRVERGADEKFQDSLISAVELMDGEDARRYGFSERLVEACVDEAHERLQGVEVSRLVPWYQARRAALLALLFAAMAIVLFASDPRTGRFLLRSYGYWSPPRQMVSPVTFRLEPGDVKVVEGSALTLRIWVEGASGGSPFLLRRLPGRAPERLTMRPDANGSWVVEMAHVYDGFIYAARLGVFESISHRVEVAAPPRVEAVTVSYVYPEYTGLVPQRQSWPNLDVIGPRGTRVTMSGRASKPLTWAAMVFEKEIWPLSVQGQAFTTSFALEGEGRFRLSLRDEDGFEAQRSNWFQLRPLVDELPKVFVYRPGRDLSVDPRELTSVSLDLAARDDYGVMNLALVVQTRQRIDYSYMDEERRHVIPVPTASVGKRQVSTSYHWPIKGHYFHPGDSITYWVEAGDAAPRKPRAFGRSRRFTITFPYKYDRYRELLGEEEEQIDDLQDVARMQKDIDQRIDRMVRRLGEQGEVAWKDRKAIQKIMDRQSGLKRKSEDLAARMRQTLESMDREQVLDPATLDKLQQVSSLFQQVASSRMKEMLQEMQQLSQGVKFDLKAMQDAAKRFDKKRYAEQLDRMLEALRNLKQKQEMDRAVERLGELAKKQEELRKDTSRRLQGGEKTQDLDGAQKELAEKAEEVAKDLDRIAENLKKDHPDTAGAVEREARRLRGEGAQGEMRQAAQALSQAMGIKAYEHQSRAINHMRAAMDGMSQARAGMQRQQASLDIEGLRKLLVFGLEVSDLQERVARDAREGLATAQSLGRNLLGGPVVAQRRREALCVRSAAVQDRVYRGMLHFERRFESLLAEELMFKEAFLVALSEIVERCKEAKDTYEARHFHSALRLSDEGLGKWNLVLARLLSLMEQMAQQAQSSSMQSYFEQLERLIQRQRKINEMTERLKESDPMNPLLRQLMMQQALEQAMIRQSMERLQQGHDEAAQLQGRLEEIAKEMKEVEAALRNMDESGDLRRKQRRILTRMIDASKSLHKQDYSRKREAEKAKKDWRLQSPANLPSELDEARNRLMRNVGRSGYPMEFRGVVEEYLRLIREREGD